MYKYIYSILHRYYMSKGEKGFSKVYSVGLLTISNVCIFLFPALPYINETETYKNNFKLLNFGVTTFFLLFNYIYCIRINNLDKNYLRKIEKYEENHVNHKRYFWFYFIFCGFCFLAMTIGAILSRK